MTLPDACCGAARLLLPLCRSPAELLAVMGSLQEVLAILAQQRQLLAERPPGPRERGGGSGGGGFGRSRLHWLLLAAAGYGQSLLSKADVAALIISRKILLTPGDASAEAADAVSLHGARSQWPACCPPGMQRNALKSAEGTSPRPLPVCSSPSCRTAPLAATCAAP